MTSRRHPAPPRTRSASVAAPAARAARPPAVVPRASSARNTVARGFEGGQMPLKQRVPKLKGFNNPFRVEYQAVNLDTLGALVERPASRRDPRGARRQRRRAQESFVKVLARGEISTKVDLHAHGVSQAAEAAITAAGGTVTLIDCPSVRKARPVARRSRATSSPTADQHRPSRTSPRRRLSTTTGAVLSVLAAGEHLQGPRSSQQDPVRRRDGGRLSPGRGHPGAGRRPDRHRAAS